MSISSYALKSFVTVSAVIGLATAGSAATSDSFFDIWVEMADDPILLDMVGAATTYETIDTEMLSMSLTSSAPTQVVSDNGAGRFVVDSFFDIEYSTDSSVNGPTTDSFFDIVVRIQFDETGRTSDSRSWDTEMLSMDLTGQAPAGGSDTRPRASTSPAHRHHGHVTILKIANPGGGGDSFQVDSFFDIWTEMSDNGGGDWFVADSFSSFEHHATVVPEPSTAALMALGLGALGVRRRLRA